jgi:hypothetical protein
MSRGLVSGNKRAPLVDRGDDLYETPPEAVHALMRSVSLPTHIWEPACGPGAIVNVLRDHGHCVYATDLNDYGFKTSVGGIDFLQWTQPPMANCIVTNPPFKLAQQFVAKAIELCPRVIMLLRLAFLESERRRAVLDAGTLSQVFVFRNRLPMMHRDGWEGNKVSSAMAFAWYVWDREHRGPAELHRISWEPLEAKLAA